MSLVEEVINKAEKMHNDGSEASSQRSQLISCYKIVLNEHNIPIVSDTRIYRLLISLGRKNLSSLKSNFSKYKAVE